MSPNESLAVGIHECILRSDCFANNSYEATYLHCCYYFTISESNNLSEQSHKSDVSLHIIFSAILDTSLF